ncbi:hypothetical protein BE15_03490 [Sorangium cellulosum]|uniref:Uncharacterized protein n=1 Tax=Sorangium cellulosum TaxID=56 RepID=A0A150QIY1_SORCE|nr:hypothetical protein BE15_03490 [Sorangium cellulosum]
MSTRCTASGRRPERRAIASVRSGNGEIHTSLPPGARARAAPSTKRSSIASRSPVRSTRRPRGGFVRISVGASPGGGAPHASRWRSSAPRAPAASRFSRAISRARGSRSDPTSRRYGPSKARSQSSRPEPTNGSQITSSPRTPAMRASAAAMVGCDAAGTSPRRYANRGSGRRGASSTRTRPAPS